MARTRHPLIFGAGLDRDSGAGLLRPDTFRDIRNVDLGEGAAMARRGFTERTALSLDGGGVTAMTDVAFLASFRAIARGVVVGYEDVGRDVQLFSTAVTGLNPTYIGDWGTLAADAGRPLVFGAESFRKFFFAHDHADITKRLKTVHWDGTTLADLEGNLDGAGAADIKFRGVTSHLDYLLGWGFGTAADPDRPEVVRVSLPGTPTTFNPEHYFLVGSPAEAVLQVISMRDFAIALKGTQLYRLEGYDRSTFAVRPADTRYGLAGSRLAALANGACFFWSLEGPRVTEGGPSEDLAIPLALDGPDPEELVASGEAEDGFAVYRQDRRVVEFHFGRRAYILHLRDPGRPRWSYAEHGIELRCAGTFYTGTAYSTAPTGHPELDTLSATASTIQFVATHVGAVGDEVLEVWLKVGAGPYIRVRNATITGLGSDVVNLTSADGVVPNTLHAISIRYRRGLTYTAGYTSTDPSSWPAASIDSITTDPFTSAPTDFNTDGGTQQQFGSKFYNSFSFTWNAGPEGSGTVISISEASDGSDRTQEYAGAIAIEATPAPLGSHLAGPTPRLRYFWIHHVLPDGTAGPLVGCLQNPINVAALAP